MVQEPVEDGRAEDFIAEHLPPFNWGWHLFLGERMPCDLAVSGVCVSLCMSC
ncbi:hypothetical protein GCM10010371_53610 [Streptomyces subrutilus]|uniref:Uncharacterized protein n=1 Tax=Streptomyces subrutilus TaxID=36818 RepID=A0A918VBV6_9ACTN|nr:hypothetical protein GCM10010371_53610 [Streptomyces subrutilus]